MEGSIWDSTETEMDLIRKETEQREDAIRTEKEREQKEITIEKARKYTENALINHTSLLVEFLGYVKGLAVRKDLANWIEIERRIWDAVKRRIEEGIINKEKEEEVGNILAERITTVLERREDSLSRIEEYIKEGKKEEM